MDDLERELRDLAPWLETPDAPDVAARVRARLAAPARRRRRWRYYLAAALVALVVAVLPPRQGEATVEKLAINAVMAGCRPEYFPVLLAAVEAVAQPAFNLDAVQATTHPVAPLLIVNGPIAK